MFRHLSKINDCIDATYSVHDMLEKTNESIKHAVDVNRFRSDATRTEYYFCECNFKLHESKSSWSMTKPLDWNTDPETEETELSGSAHRHTPNTRSKENPNKNRSVTRLWTPQALTVSNSTHPTQTMPVTKKIQNWDWNFLKSQQAVSTEKHVSWVSIVITWLY